MLKFTYTHTDTQTRTHIHTYTRAHTYTHTQHAQNWTLVQFAGKEGRKSITRSATADWKGVTHSDLDRLLVQRCVTFELAV